MSHPEFAGKSAVVTGGATGVGLATARLLAERGANVAVVGHDAATVATVAAELERMAWRYGGWWPMFAMRSRCGVPSGELLHGCRVSGRWRSFGEVGVVLRE